MAKTFRDVWSKVLLHAPTVPAALAQTWVQDGYDFLIANRHWAWTRRQHTLTTRAQRSVQVSFQQGSSTITSAGQFIAGEDPGRQIRVANDFIYTIQQVIDPNQALLSQIYAEASGSKAAGLSDIYLPMPEDFRSFETVLDMENSRPVCWWISKERLDLFDPARISADSRLRVLAAHQISQVPALSGRLLYEAWPHPTSAGTYVMSYFTRMDDLQNDTPFQGVLATYTKVLETYALSEAATWPGTADQKNPYFNLPLAKKLREDFEETYRSIDVMDDDQYLMDLSLVDLSSFGLAAVSASTNLLQRTDADSSDYFGGFR